MSNIILDFFHNITKRSNPRLNAKDAYLKAKYQRIQTEEERLNEFKFNLDTLISIKCDSCTCCCVVELEEDLSKHLNDIIKEYRELGYTVINLKDEVEDIDNNCLFLCWDKKY